MDTIIYFYQKGIEKPEVEPAGQKTYMLIRVAVDVGEEIWFGRKTEQEDSEHVVKTEKEASELSSDRSEWKMFFPLRFFWRRHMDRKQKRLAQKAELAARREEQRLKAEWEERIRFVRNSVRELSHEILELTGDWRDCYLVYEDSVRKGLVAKEGEPNRQRRILPLLWRESFPAPEFEQYTKSFWVEYLLSEAVLPHFVVLGKAPCLYPLLRQHACRMKSLCWILENTSCDQELLDFVEDFYEEYGLAITLQTFEPGSLAPWKTEGAGAMRQLLLRQGSGVNILDFTKEPHIALGEAAPGSIWLDMMSVEAKQRRAWAKGSKVTYFSLKTKWRRAQKRCNCPVLP